MLLSKMIMTCIQLLRSEPRWESGIGCNDELVESRTQLEIQDNIWYDRLDSSVESILLTWSGSATICLLYHRACSIPEMGCVCCSCWLSHRRYRHFCLEYHISDSAIYIWRWKRKSSGSASSWSAHFDTCWNHGRTDCFRDHGGHIRSPKNVWFRIDHLDHWVPWYSYGIRGCRKYERLGLGHRMARYHGNGDRRRLPSGNSSL